MEEPWDCAGLAQGNRPGTGQPPTLFQRLLLPACLRPCKTHTLLSAAVHRTVNLPVCLAAPLAPLPRLPARCPNRPQIDRPQCAPLLSTSHSFPALDPLMAHENGASHTVSSVAHKTANVGTVSPGDLKAALLHIVAAHSLLTTAWPAPYTRPALRNRLTATCISRYRGWSAATATPNRCRRASPVARPRCHGTRPQPIAESPSSPVCAIDFSVGFLMVAS